VTFVSLVYQIQRLCEWLRNVRYALEALAKSNSVKTLSPSNSTTSSTVTSLFCRSAPAPVAPSSTSHHDLTPLTDSTEKRCCCAQVRGTRRGDRGRARSDKRASLLCSSAWYSKGRPGAGAVRQKSFVAVLKCVVLEGATGGGRGPTEELRCCAQVRGTRRARPGAGAIRQKSFVAVLKCVVLEGLTVGGRGPTKELRCCAQVRGTRRGDRGRARSDKRASLLCSSAWYSKGRPGAGAVRQKSFVAVLKVRGTRRGDRGRARSDRRASLLCSSAWRVKGTSSNSVCFLQAPL